MTPLSRPVMVLFLALCAASKSSGSGNELRLKPGTPRNTDSTTSSSGSAGVPGTTNVSVTLDALTNRHAISPYVYGGAYPQDAPTITDSG